MLKFGQEGWIEKSDKTPEVKSLSISKAAFEKNAERARIQTAIYK